MQHSLFGPIFGRESGKANAAQQGQADANGNDALWIVSNPETQLAEKAIDATIHRVAKAFHAGGFAGVVGIC